MTRIICYVDGFNLYHSLKDFEDKGKITNKYVNLWELIESYKKENEKLVAVKYFSAYATWNTRRYRKHQRYVKALEQAGVTVVMSHFKERKQYCNRCGASWVSHEEKETDVRLSLEVFKDAMNDEVDRAYIVSADSDLVAPIRLVKEQFPNKGVFLLIPPGRYSVARDLRNAAHAGIEMRISKVGSSLFERI